MGKKKKKKKKQSKKDKKSLMSWLLDITTFIANIIAIITFLKNL